MLMEQQPLIKTLAAGTPPTNQYAQWTARTIGYAECLGRQPKHTWGRSLGAVGRQYGSNAEAARTLLTGTKGWSISGDSPSGQDCGGLTPQTITAADMTKTYGDPAFVPAATASSGLEAGNATYNPARMNHSHSDSTKAPLAVKADTLSKVFGTADPALTYTATGFVYNEDQTVLTGALTRAAGEAIGTYAITQGTLAAENYDITFTDANFTITKAASADGDFVTVWTCRKADEPRNFLSFAVTTAPGAG
ncbi:hypothetical protein FQR65_LT17214 [Abscondita terminalis]|nr:hypothetical protein FQR65_LT17214 [Abscondita terminalis]